MFWAPRICVLLLLLCASVSAHDPLPAPEDLQISIPVFGKVKLSWKAVTDPKKRSLEYKAQLLLPGLEDEHQYTMEVEVPPRLPESEFAFVPLHHGLKAKVSVTLDGKVLQWVTKDLPPSKGEEGTAAEQIRCEIHLNEKQEALLLCDWLPGKQAPKDTLYFLYFRYMESGVETMGTCRQYVAEPGGQRRTGCRAQLSSRISDEVFIRINGTSNSWVIRDVDCIFKGNDIELLPPVRNFALHPEKNNRLSWELPLNLPDCLTYEVNIWTQANNWTDTVPSLTFWHKDLEAPASKTHVRVRAIGKTPCWDEVSPTSPWSEVIDIEGTEDNTLWIVLSVCFLMGGLALFLFCVRFWSCMFPQIPRPKDDLKEAFNFTQQQTLMRCNSWDTEEVISYVEVMKCPDMPYKNLRTSVLSPTERGTDPSYGHDMPDMRPMR